MPPRETYTQLDDGSHTSNQPPRQKVEPRPFCSLAPQRQPWTWLVRQLLLCLACLLSILSVRFCIYFYMKLGPASSTQDNSTVLTILSFTHRMLLVFLARVCTLSCQASVPGSGMGELRLYTASAPSDNAFPVSSWWWRFLFSIQIRTCCWLRVLWPSPLSGLPLDFQHDLLTNESLSLKEVSVTHLYHLLSGIV